MKDMKDGGPAFPSLCPHCGTIYLGPVHTCHAASGGTWGASGGRDIQRCPVCAAVLVAGTFHACVGPEGTTGYPGYSPNYSPNDQTLAADAFAAGRKAGRAEAFREAARMMDKNHRDGGWTWPGLVQFIEEKAKEEKR